MRSHRAGALLLLSLFAVSLAPVQSPASSLASNQDLPRQRPTPERVNTPMDGPNTRLASTRNEAPPESDRTSLASVLFVFLAIAVVFEAAMSAIFDWRVFIRKFEGKGVKTLVLVGTALAVTFTYDLDILHQILEALDRPRPEHEIGKVITALLISGGSSAVFRVYSNLGIRSPAERRRKAREERESQADAAPPPANASNDTQS